MIERILCHYRVAFYEKVRHSLFKNGIEFTLIYGQGTAAEKQKKDNARIFWAVEIKNHYLPFGMVWQPCMKYLIGSSLVIADLANKHLLNYYLLYMFRKTNHKVAFFGHYTNHQIRSTHLFNAIKKRYSTLCDWWFCYTENEKKALIDTEYNEDQITVFNNSVDTRESVTQYDSISTSEVKVFTDKIKLNTGYTGIYCGGLYGEKRIDFLIKACEKIRCIIPEFHLIVIGSGIEKGKVEAASKKHEWIHYLGPLFGRDKALAFKASDVFVCPGAVGLAILDSFCFKVPMVTTDIAYHGPEIAYLENDINGLICNNTMDSFVQSVTDLLKDRNRLSKLKMNCDRSSRKYTIENMADLFSAGIKNCVKC